MNELVTASLISDVAHTGQGQYRADKVTPYRNHPQAVAAYVAQWYREEKTPLLNASELTTALCAAMLHDVLEDTKITIVDLRRYGMSQGVVDVVSLLTKENRPDEPESPLYYTRVASSHIALTVKCADRCSNLDDALDEVKRTSGLKRWKRYVERTVSDVLPLYEAHPKLLLELKDRASAIQARLYEQRVTV